MGRGSARSATPRSARRTYFSVTVRWEYTVVPRYPQRRFVCVSDREEYAEVASDPGATSPWFLKPETGIDPTDEKAFQLVQFTINGEPRSIRRAVRKRGQTYTVTIGEDLIASGEPVVVSYTYQTITSTDDPLLFSTSSNPPGTYESTSTTPAAVSNTSAPSTSFPP